MLLTLKVSNFSSFVFNMGIMIKIGFPGVSVVKNPPANAGDLGSIPGSGRSSEEEMATHSIAWKTTWTEEPGRLQSMGSQSSSHD